MSIFAKRKESIDRYLSFVTTFTSGLIGGIFLLSLVLFALFSALSTAKDRGDSYADILAYNLQASLAFSDQQSAQTTLESVANIDDVIGIEVTEKQGSVFVKTGSVPSDGTSSHALFRSIYVALNLSQDWRMKFRYKQPVWLDLNGPQSALDRHVSISVSTSF